jgi:hypothetical protein
MKQLVILFICFIHCVQSYGQAGITPTNTAFFQATKIRLNYSAFAQINKNERNIVAKNTLAPIPSAYCYQNLAFFCKIEVKLEKASTFPVKFRLGSIPYVDFLEQK